MSYLICLVLEPLYSKYYSLFTTTRNGIFLGFPLVFLSSLKTNITPRYNFFLSILFILLLILEYIIAKNQINARDHNFYISIPSFIKFFFDWVKSLNINMSYNASVFFRKYSLGIYLIHPFWIELKPKLLVGGGMADYILVILLSIFSIYILKKLNIPLLNKILD